MESEHLSPILTLLAFVPIFLVSISAIRELSKLLKFPYTVALLLAGFLTQILVIVFHLPHHLVLTPEVIYYILLPTLLFEATIHLNFHQLKLQFLTITFISTFGLLVSLFLVGGTLAYFLGLPLPVALLFGALISATDPIAVLALFKSLGAPKRLALLADGESMFNDATAVIAFRLISGFAVVGSTDFGIHVVFSGIWEFLYIFLGSIIAGLTAGYIASKALTYIKNDKMSETALTMVLAYGSFYFSEHLFALSGIIVCVIAGITLGNIGKTKVSEGTMPFVEEIWEYLGFVALSVVFFFAAANLDFAIFEKDLAKLPIVIGAILVARAVSVYASFYLSNRLKFFKSEPNVPMSWQHVINWGGLRGVIPLVLVLSLPDHFEYKADILAYTMGALLFTLFVNGLSIEKLLIKLKLHIPKKEDDLIREESSLYHLENVRRNLKNIRMEGAFDKKLIKVLDGEILKEETRHNLNLAKLAETADIETGLKVECLHIEKHKLYDLFAKGYISESVYFMFEAQIDLQEDALEYPEVYEGRGFTGGGYIQTTRSFRLLLSKYRDMFRTLPLLSKIVGVDEKTLIQNRFAMLSARLMTTYDVYHYLDRVGTMYPTNGINSSVKKVRNLYENFEKSNVLEIKKLKAAYSTIIDTYQNKVLHKIVKRELALIQPSHI